MTHNQGVLGIVRGLKIRDSRQPDISVLYNGCVRLGYICQMLSNASNKVYEPFVYLTKGAEVVQHEICVIYHTPEYFMTAVIPCTFAKSGSKTEDWEQCSQ